MSRSNDEACVDCAQVAELLRVIERVHDIATRAPAVPFSDTEILMAIEVITQPYVNKADNC